MKRTGAAGGASTAAAAGSASSSSRAAIRPSVRCSYTSETAIEGCVSRSTVTSWAAARELPPRSKKSLASVIGTAPSCSAQRSASHAAVPLRDVVASSAGGGQGRALRSTLPLVLVGSSSSATTSGTIPAGQALGQGGAHGGGIGLADEVAD